MSYWINATMTTADNGRNNVRKGVETMLKTSEMTLKTPGNHLSFGLNGSHKARKFNSAKSPRFCPPPDISKANASKEVQLIMTAHHRQNGRNCLVDKDFWNRTFSKNTMSWTEYTKYNLAGAAHRAA